MRVLVLLVVVSLALVFVAPRVEATVDFTFFRDITNTTFNATSGRNETKVVRANAIPYTTLGSLRLTGLYAITLTRFGPQNFARRTNVPMYFYDTSANGCPEESRFQTDQFLVTYNGTVWRPVIVSISGLQRCPPEQYIPAAYKAGASALIYCDPVFSKATSGWNSYSLYKTGFDHKSLPQIPFLVVSEAASVCGPARGQQAQRRPVLVSFSPDENDWLSPVDYWQAGYYFVLVRVICPIWSFSLAIWAMYKLYRYIRQQKGVQWASLAQWTMFNEIVGNVLRGTFLICTKTVVTAEASFGLNVGEGFVLNNMILAALFWGTLDVNSSPLYRFRYFAGILCVAFLGTTIGLAIDAGEHGGSSVQAETFNHFLLNCEAAIGCLVFLLVLKRLTQLARYSSLQAEATAPAASTEAGEAAVAAHSENEDDDEGEGGSAASTSQAAEASAVQVQAPKPADPAVGKTRHAPVARKLYYWCFLVGLNCVCAVIHLIVVELYESVVPFDRQSKRNWFMRMFARGVLGSTMSTTQLLLFVPKKKSGETGSTVAGSAQMASKTGSV